MPTIWGSKSGTSLSSSPPIHPDPREVSFLSCMMVIAAKPHPFTLYVRSRFRMVSTKVRRCSGFSSYLPYIQSLPFLFVHVLHLQRCRFLLSNIFPSLFNSSYLNFRSSFGSLHLPLPALFLVHTMDADRRLTKALEAANDALQHISMSPNLGALDCTHIDRLLARVVDLPTEGNQRNSRRNLLVIRQWMVTEGPGVVLLEVLGNLYWRLGELNSKQFEKFKEALQQQQAYLALTQSTDAVALVLQRVRYIQRSKADACQDFLCELSDITGTKGKCFSTLTTSSPC
jgi:hypothetical protein